MSRATSEPRVAGLILAAGASVRMGRFKPLLSFRGRPLAQHALDAALAGGADPIVLVLGHEAEAMRREIELPANGRFVTNPDPGRGQASSLATGLAALPPDAQATLVLLSDQPEIRPEVIRGAIATYRRTGGPVVRTAYRGVPGHPVILDRTVWEEVAGVEGDTGAQPVLERHPEWVVVHPVDAPPPLEVDTPADYRALTDEPT